ncbi:MAG: hypothetical protein ACAH83_16330 [Alphaproteobacteria bacterium]
MQAFFNRARTPDPDLSLLSDAEFAAWEQRLARRQKIRTRVFETLRVGTLLAGVGVGIGLVAWSLSSIILPLSYLVGPACLGSVYLCWEGANRCESHKTSPDLASLNAEKARREREVPASVPSAAPPDLPSCADVFAAAARNGIQEKVTVGRPLRLVKKSVMKL